VRFPSDRRRQRVNRHDGQGRGHYSLYRMTPDAAQDTRPHREAVPHIPLPLPLVELALEES